MKHRVQVLALVLFFGVLGAGCGGSTQTVSLYGGFTPLPNITASVPKTHRATPRQMVDSDSEPRWDAGLIPPREVKERLNKNFNDLAHGKFKIDPNTPYLDDTETFRQHYKSVLVRKWELEGLEHQNYTIPNDYFEVQDKIMEAAINAELKMCKEAALKGDRVTSDYWLGQALANARHRELDEAVMAQMIAFQKNLFSK